MKSPPERPRVSFAHAALLAAALVLAFAAGRSRDIDLDLKVDPLAPLPSAERARDRGASETFDDGTIELSRGFYPAETATDGASYRWMSGRGVITLRHQGPTMTLTLSGWLPTTTGKALTTVDLMIDQRPIGRIEATAGSFRQSFTVTDLEPRPDGHRVFIQVSETVVAPPDPRRLGICLETISWQSADAGAASGDAG